MKQTMHAGRPARRRPALPYGHHGLVSFENISSSENRLLQIQYAAAGARWSSLEPGIDVCSAKTFNECDECERKARSETFISLILIVPRGRGRHCCCVLSSWKFNQPGLEMNIAHIKQRMENREVVPQPAPGARSIWSDEVSVRLLGHASTTANSEPSSS